MYNKVHVSFRHCFTLAAVLCLLCLSFSARCSADPVQAHQYVPVPFTALHGDNDFAPHQLITVLIRKNKFLPPVSATFLFDTGTTHCAITSSLAAKLSLVRHTAKDQSGEILKFDGAVMPFATVANLEVGALSVRDFDFTVLPDKLLSQMNN